MIYVTESNQPKLILQKHLTGNALVLWFKNSFPNHKDCKHFKFKEVSIKNKCKYWPLTKVKEENLDQLNTLSKIFCSQVKKEQTIHGIKEKENSFCYNYKLFVNTSS